MSSTDNLKLFHLNKALLEADLSTVEKIYDVKILPSRTVIERKDETFYPQFPAAIRQKAKEMAAHYEAFYLLENSIRDLVSEALLSAEGEDWWDKTVPKEVQDNATVNAKRERDAGVSPRSTEPIDYTNFGELSTIIQANWENFSDLFNSKSGLVSVLARLNLLRGPIAHCAALTEDEVLRLQLSLRDWFRLME